METGDGLPRVPQQALSNHGPALKFSFRCTCSGLQKEGLLLTSKVVGKKCPVSAALITTVEKIVRETDRGLVRDAWLVAGARKTEEFEIASYHAALQWALSLGHTYQASLLEATLAEERGADDLFRSIEERINLAVKAA